jgi:FkbM family methyltransferase
MDVGANVGLFTLVAAERDTCVAVHAFEPDARSLTFLHRNIARAGAVNCQVHPVAISTMSGQAALWSPDGSSGRSMLVSADEVAGAQSVHVVASDCVDEVLDSVEHAIFCKIDVEGHEDRVLAALLRHPVERFGAFWVEFSAATDAAACREMLSEAGFSEVLRSGSEQHFDALWVARADPFGLG